MSDSKTSFINPFRALELHRYPVRKNELLQAWDSGDELLLNHLAAIELKNKRILIINDQFGALSCALHGFQIQSATDSYVSAKGFSLNAKLNGHADGSLDHRSAFQSWTGIYDLVLIKLPHTLSYFEDILAHLSKHLAPHSQVITAAMVKYLPKNAFLLIQKYIGGTTTSLAEKKARLIFASFEKSPVNSPYPTRVMLDGFEKPFLQHSNLFSREKLDVGTRFFLKNLPRGNYETILDLGCANGVVGIQAKRLNPQAKVIFCDDSKQALESARDNYRSYFEDEAKYVWTNCYELQEACSLDLVLCNPPFHQKTVVGDHIAWQMFQDAHSALKEGRFLRVIGNSHLRYPEKLRKIFGNAKIIAQDQKFTIVEAQKNHSVD